MEVQSQTVGEVAAGSTAAGRILEQYGIDYCCAGKRSFEDVCREKGLSPASVASEIAAATALPAQSKDWNTAPLRELIRHIVSTHHEYLKLELPRLRQRLRKVVQVHSASDLAALPELESVYQGLWQELDLHMHKEEMMLFPAIERYEAATQSGLPLPPAPFGSIANPISVMEAEHDSAGFALQRIRELTSDFQAPSYACATYHAMLEGLRALPICTRTFTSRTTSFSPVSLPWKSGSRVLRAKNETANPGRLVATQTHTL
jgi:regulator of cell morphogenesis and NO signaling